MDVEKIKRALDTVESLAKAMREGSKIIADQQRHQDSMVVWLVGLASTAVIALPATYNYIWDLRTAPGWALGIPIAFFVLAVLCGIAVRLLLWKLMQEDALAASMKIFGWEALRVKYPVDEEGRKKILEDALEILRDKDEKIAAQTGKAATIACYTRILE